MGGIFLSGAVKLGLGSVNEPGPGFFPFLMAVCLISFSSIDLISCAKKSRTLDVVEREEFWPGSRGAKKIVFVIISLFIFIIGLNHLGFVPIVFLFTFFHLRFIETQKWLTVFIMASLFTSLSYAIFQLLLKANLPKGLLGF